MDRFEMTIEVLDGDSSASAWLQSWGEDVQSVAAGFGLDFRSHRHRWGVLLSLAFRSEEDWEWFLRFPTVRAALDSVPRPVNGVIYHRGWGGTGTDGERLRPRPNLGSGAVGLPEPVSDPLSDAVVRVLVGV